MKQAIIFRLLIENWPHVTFLEKNLFGFALLFKCLHGQYDLDVAGYLQFYELEHEPYNLRNAELMFKTIYARTDTLKYSFFFLEL